MNSVHTSTTTRVGDGSEPKSNEGNGLVEVIRGPYEPLVGSGSS